MSRIPLQIQHRYPQGEPVPHQVICFGFAYQLARGRVVKTLGGGLVVEATFKRTS